jgi:fluoroquinolone transport system ATP-binding protein
LRPTGTLAEASLREPGVIDVDDLSFHYAGADRAAITGLRFRVEQGEIFGFLGPSGAGKSTTQKLLTGQLREFQGQAHVAGRALRDWEPDCYQRIGVSFEVPNLYLKLSARENLAYFGSLYAGPGEDPSQLLSRVGLADEADLRVSQFSKGMKVRLGFVRALLHRPELLFLDEPTAGLDPVNARIVKDLIREQREAGRTVFLTTHDMTVADELCDRVAFIVDGRLAQVDAPRTLKHRYGRREVRLEYRRDGVLESREFPLDGLGENTGFLELLRSEKLETLHTQETSLERVFIEVTGRSLS